MKKIFRRISALSLLIVCVLLLSNTYVYASSHAYITKTHAGVKANYVVIDMNDKSIKPIVITAKNKLTATDTIANMAKSYGALAAINGTYFEAYGKTYKYPIAYNTIVKDGKLLRSSNHPIAGITSDGKLIIDKF